MFDRIVALIAKELASLWKDRKTRIILLVPPLIQVMIFAYAATFDVSHAPLGIWNEDRGAQSAELVRRFAASTAFTVVAAPSEPKAAAAALDAKRVAAVLHIGEKFSADLIAGRPAAVQLLLDARRSNTALLIEGYATAITTQFVLDQNPTQPPPVVIETRDWFNPALEPKWFILPGLVAILSLMMAMLVSALSLSRERELGTFEQLLVTPLRPQEVLIGKAIPAIIVGMLDAHMVIAAALLVFRLPFVGNLLLLEVSLLIYMIAGVGIGLAISSVTRTQQQAMLGVFIVASPSIVLSGYAAPVENMPASVEWLSRVDPIRYMLIIARGTFLQDMPFAVAWHALWPMALIATVLMSIAVVAVRRAVT
jgi:ABC-2 type transport system permease protein